MIRKLLSALVLVAMLGSFAFALGMLRQAIGIASPWFGLTVMFIVTGIVAVVRPFFLPRLPEFLRRIRAWEARGAVYRALRVPAFGALLRRPPLRYLNTVVYLGKGDDPSAVIAQVEAAEFAHVAAGIVLVPYIVIAHSRGQPGAAAVLWAFEIFFNAYPIMHLRWTRSRLARVVAVRRRKT